MPPRANLILIQEPEVFFTTETSDKDLIKRWLTYWKVEYLMFYASFLNHAIASVQRALDKNLTDGKEYALLVVLQVSITADRGLEIAHIAAEALMPGCCC